MYEIKLKNKKIIKKKTEIFWILTIRWNNVKIGLANLQKYWICRDGQLKINNKIHKLYDVKLEIKKKIIAIQVFT